MPVSQGFCRSELAREELTGTALIQEALVIVDVFREQARSYRIGRSADSMWELACLRWRPFNRQRCRMCRR